MGVDEVDGSVGDRDGVRIVESRPDQRGIRSVEIDAYDAGTTAPVRVVEMAGRIIINNNNNKINN